MPLSFKIFDIHQGGFHYAGASMDIAMEAFNTILDEHESGQLSDRQCAAQLERLAELEPDFIDGHTHLGFNLHAQGKPKKALEQYLKALAIGDRLIPEGFAGHIEWGYLDNRPFLRAMHGAAICYADLRRHGEAASMLERLLAYNPDDNQGARYLLGSEYLRLGDREKARQLFEAEAAHFPPYYYELALLHQQAGNWNAAATALRRGFFGNPYIAEMLCGHPNPMPLIVWHSSNFAEPETARHYVHKQGDLWRRRPDFVAFLHWLYNQPGILAERAVFLGYAEQLLWEQDFQRRGDILASMAQALNGIDEASSASIVVKRPDGHGGSEFPWLRTLDQ